MDCGESRQMRCAHPAAHRLLLERSAAAVEDSRAFGNQELAVPGFVGHGHLGTAAGDQAADSRRISVRQSDDLLSGGLLCNLSAASLPASYRARDADFGGLSGF